MKSFLVFCTFACLSKPMCAQHFYIEASGTYQFPIGGSTETRENWYIDTDTMRVAEISRVNINYGQGFGVGLMCGVDLSEQIAAELRMTWFPGSRFSWTDIYRGGETSNTVSSRFLRLEPALRFKKTHGAFSWYIAGGPSFALWPKCTVTQNALNNWTGTDHMDESEMEHTGGLGFGGFVGFGSTYALGEHWCVFAELNCTAQSWSPRKGELTHRMHDAEDWLLSYPTYMREVVYVDEYDTNDLDSDQPRKALRFHYPMSTWGFRIGIGFVFGRKPTQATGEE